MAINLEKMLRPSREMKKTARDIKNTVRGTGNGAKSKPVKKAPRRRKKKPLTMEQKNAAQSKVFDDMGFKPLGYWAKEFERFID